MHYLLLTKSTTFIIGPIATVLGYIMNAIFNMLDSMGMANVGGAIFIFTIIINLILLPLTIRQQRSSKLNSVIMPEVQAIQNKYKGKNDQASMVKMQDETKAVYEKYGSSPTGGCLTSFIQLPILFALYQVIYRLPAYVDKLNVLYANIVTALQQSYPDYASVEALTDLASGTRVTGELTANKMIDLLYSFNSAKWETFIELFPNISEVIEESRVGITAYNTFLGMNLSENPGFSFPIILIPILAGLLQWVSVKLSFGATQNQNSNAQDSTMQTMNMMNNIMPLMSVVFCFMLPAGVGIYWVASSGVRCIIQVFVNRYIQNMDVDALIEKNVEKMNAKRQKQGLAPIKPTRVTEAQLQALQETREEREAKEAEARRQEEARSERLKTNASYYTEGEENPNSIAARAGMVKKYNDRADEKRKKK